MDAIGLLLMAFGTTTTAAMILTEKWPLPIRRDKPKPQTLRKFLSCWAYAGSLGLVGWAAGLVEMPVAGWRGILGVVLMSFLSTVLASGIVQGKKVLTS
ncbi:MAG: hypothetical protein ACE5JX_19210 [Acidobacteriota bacterium]